jgi:surfeit locus 1 family protein
MDKRLLSFRWIAITLGVVALAAVMVRLGFWQLDRLSQRRQLNGFVESQIAMAPINLNVSPDLPGLDGMDYRPVVVSGEYKFAEQVVLRNKSYQGMPGGHLLTPLRITGTQEAVIVDRGWISLTDLNAGHLERFDEPGMVVVKGAISLSQEDYPTGGTVDPTMAPDGSRLTALNLVNLTRLSPQVSEQLLPIYIQEEPSKDWTRQPYRVAAAPDLSDGPHLSYAVQWFSFAAIVLVGYPILVKRQLAQRGLKEKKNA